MDLIHHIIWRPTSESGVKFTNIKTLLSYFLTATFPMKNYASVENCDIRASWISTQNTRLVQYFNGLYLTQRSECQSSKSSICIVDSLWLLCNKWKKNQNILSGQESMTGRMARWAVLQLLPAQTCRKMPSRSLFHFKDCPGETKYMKHDVTWPYCNVNKPSSSTNMHWRLTTSNLTWHDLIAMLTSLVQIQTCLYPPLNCTTSTHQRWDGH